MIVRSSRPNLDATEVDVLLSHKDDGAGMFSSVHPTRCFRRNGLGVFVAILLCQDVSPCEDVSCWDDCMKLYANDY